MDARHYQHRKLTEARKLTGKSMQQVAEEMSVDRQTIWRAEAGQSISYELLTALCALYRIPMTSIIVDFPENATAA